MNMPEIIHINNIRADTIVLSRGLKITPLIKRLCSENFQYLGQMKPFETNYLKSERLKSSYEPAGGRVRFHEHNKFFNTNLSKLKAKSFFEIGRKFWIFKKFPLEIS